jgi:NitT/TauT family transport system permease protein
MMQKIMQVLRGVWVPLIVVVIWESLGRLGLFSPTVLPAPSAVMTKWIAYLLPLEPFDPAQASYLRWLVSGELPQDAASSLSRVVMGYAIGVGLALPLGLLMGAYKRAYDLCNPLVQFLRPIPPSAYIPLAILWFGLGSPPSVFLIFIAAFFPVLMNTIAGVRHVDGIYLRAARNLGAGQGTIFWRVMLPAATPYIFAGMRVGIGTAFILVIISELIAVNAGLGYRIMEAREFMWSDKVIAGMFTIGLLGLGIDTVMSRLNNHLLRWHRGLDH